ncbi:hypothetical protein SK128_008552 [Halocaridina rubra]|uniref:Uncharacterized protein n=1 Tax=Halocaridina rubra TaxID=373956 RepID=A0AAN8XGB2_HALRR
MTSGAGQPHFTHREKFVQKHFEFLWPHIARHLDTQVLGNPEMSARVWRGPLAWVVEPQCPPRTEGPALCPEGHRRMKAEEDEDEVEEFARVEHTTRPKRKRKPDRPSTASISSAAGPKEQEEIGCMLTGMGTDN